LIEFGRYAARDRRRRGQGKPETFDFLGFTHICATSRKGRFWVKRVTIAKRMRAKLKAINQELKRRRHEPIADQGRWLRSVLNGHMGYFAVPGNTRRVSAFRFQVTRYWYKAPRRRSQRDRLKWERMGRIAAHWLPKVRVRHPFPSERLAARP
jgi:RNA-directed DNA polymerase